MKIFEWALSLVPRTWWGKLLAMLAIFLLGVAVGGLLIAVGYHG